MLNFEFLVHEVHVEKNTILVSGIVNKGDIPVGGVFDFVLDESIHKDEVRLSVVKIIAYRREIASLPQGMSGELHLVGVGVKFVKKGSALSASCNVDEINGKIG